LFSSDLKKKSNRAGKGMLFFEKVEIEKPEIGNFKTNRYGFSTDKESFFIPQII